MQARLGRVREPAPAARVMTVFKADGCVSLRDHAHARTDAEVVSRGKALPVGEIVEQPSTIPCELPRGVSQGVEFVDTAD